MTDQQSLSGAEREALARELTDERLELTEPVAKPRAVLTAGQPGSGKSLIVNSIAVQFDGIGGAVVVDPDRVRPSIPYMEERIAKGDLAIPEAAFADAGTVAIMMVHNAADARRNIIYDGTLSNLTYARQNADFLRGLNYQVEIHGMAVAPDLSHARTYSRREEEIRESDTGFGRGVEDDFHDKAVTGLVKTIEALQAEGRVDAIVLYDKQGKEVASTRLVDGKWVPERNMAADLQRAHDRPDQAEREEAVKRWSFASDMMRERGADPDEQRKVDGFRDAARERVAPTMASENGRDELIGTDSETAPLVAKEANASRQFGITGEAGAIEQEQTSSMVDAVAAAPRQEPDFKSKIEAQAQRHRLADPLQEIVRQSLERGLDQESHARRMTITEIVQEIAVVEPVARNQAQKSVEEARLSVLKGSAPASDFNRAADMNDWIVREGNMAALTEKLEQVADGQVTIRYEPGASALDRLTSIADGINIELLRQRDVPAPTHTPPVRNIAHEDIER